MLLVWGVGCVIGLWLGGDGEVKKRLKELKERWLAKIIKVEKTPHTPKLNF